MELIEVITMQRPFTGIKDRTNIREIISGWRPSFPPDPNEWLLDNVWDIVSKCWSPSWGGRPDASTVIIALNSAADAFEAQNSWEAELTDFLRACKTGIDKKVEDKRAKEFADKLDVVRRSGTQVCLIPDRVSRFLTKRNSPTRNENST